MENAHFLDLLRPESESNDTNNIDIEEDSNHNRRPSFHRHTREFRRTEQELESEANSNNNNKPISNNKLILGEGELTALSTPTLQSEHVQPHNSAEPLSVEKYNINNISTAGSTDNDKDSTALYNSNNSTNNNKNNNNSIVKDDNNNKHFPIVNNTISNTKKDISLSHSKLNVGPERQSYSYDYTDHQDQVQDHPQQL